jgi:hypothetical protein
LVLFHSTDINHKDIPVIRKPEQLYVFYNYESPFHSRAGYRKLPDNFFNLTYTYRTDSDLPVFAGDFEPINKETKSDEIWDWEEVKIVKKSNLKIRQK